MPDAPTSDLRLLAGFLRPERRKVGALVTLLVIARLLPLAGPLVLARFVDSAASRRPTGVLLGLAGAYLAIAVVAEVLLLAVTWGAVEVAWRAGNRLRERLAAHALRLDLPWHASHAPGVLIERVDGDVEAVTRFTGSAVADLVGNAVLVAGALVVSVAIDWRAGAAVVLVTASAVAALAGLRSLGVPASDARREVESKLYGDVEERLGGIEDLRANGAGGYGVHRLLVHSAALWRAQRREAVRIDAGYAVAGVVHALGTAAVVGLAVALERRGAISLGSILALARYVQLVRRPLEQVAEQLQEMQKAAAGLRRTARLLGERPSIVDGPGPAPGAGALTVELDGVTFAYERGGEPALRDVTLRIPAGAVLGVVGRTGSGKTTLGRLMARLWDVDDGAVRLGGVDVRDVPLADLRRHIAVVTQDVELFRASVRDNVTLFGALVADDERLRTVLGDVGLGEWLARLPGGLDEDLAGADRLSAGQAQLLALARAFLADPGVVVLDEASSRLDPATEARLVEATDRLLSGRTAVVVAHRLATLDRADLIAVVDDGAVVEWGPREALAADPSSRFAALASAGTALLGDHP